MKRLKREWEIFCCWLNGHNLQKRDAMVNWRSCRCGTRQVSEEQRYYKSNWNRQRPININVQVMNNATEQIERLSKRVSYFGRR